MKITRQYPTLIAVLTLFTTVYPGTVHIDTNTVHQKIDGFGASIVSGSDVRRAVYDDPEYLDFLAYELGMSILRMAIEPEVSSVVIEDPENIRYEDFNLSGTAGLGANDSIRFARNMIERDPTFRVIGTAWSAPGWMKDNNSTHGSRSGFLLSANRTWDHDNRLSDHRYDHYAKWLVEYYKFLQSRDIPLYAISPQNELMFTQYFDSAMYTATEYARIVRKLGQRFETEGIERPLIFGPEDMTEAHYDTNRHRPYVDALMAEDTREYFDAFATHGYTDGVQAGSPMDPETYWNGIKQFNRPFWITEGGTGGHDWPTPIVNGIGAYLHHALVNGNVELFTAWQIMDPDPNTHGIMHWDQPTKKTFAAMHYWRFIRPGFQRVDTHTTGFNSSGLRISAFKNPSDNRIVIVIINTNTATRSFDIDIDGVGVDALDAFQTSANQDFEHIGTLSAENGKFPVSLPARSITTFTVLKPVSDIAMETVAIEVEVGLRQRLMANTVPFDATNRKLHWTSEDPNIATVDATGGVHGVSEGTTTIHATTDERGFATSAEVTVIPRIEWPWAEWQVRNNYATTGSNFMGRLFPQQDNNWVYVDSIRNWVFLPEDHVRPGFSWIGFINPQAAREENSVSTVAHKTLNNEFPNPEPFAPMSEPVHYNVAPGKAITGSGSAGSSTVDLLIDGNNSTDANTRWSVETYPQWARIDLQGIYNISEFRLYPLENRDYQYTVETSMDGQNFELVVDRRNNNQNATYFANTVDTTARYVLLTITGAGAYSGPWISLGEFEVFGAPAAVPVEGIAISHHSVSRGVGQHWQLKAEVIPSYANNTTISWVSSDPQIASVDTSGRVAAASIGTAVITATTQEGGFTASAEVQVTDTPQWAKWDVQENEIVDTGSFIGSISIAPDSSWVYSHRFGRWIYIPEESVNQPLVWGLLYRNQP